MIQKSIYRVLLLAVVGLAICAPTALATPFTPELEADYAFAAEWWGAMPVGCSSIDRELFPLEQMPEELAGLATIPDLNAPPIACIIWIVGGLASACSQREIVLHEYGHLLGYGHSDDPTNIMYPQMPGFLCRQESEESFHQRLQREVRRCRNLRPSLHRRECWLGVKQERHAYIELFG